jgi:hypothetical protein
MIWEKCARSSAREGGKKWGVEVLENCVLREGNRREEQEAVEDSEGTL